MQLSALGKKLTARTGIVELMDDLGSALNENPDMIFMGGGNPARLPSLEEAFKKQLQAVAGDAERLHSMVGIYQSPLGDLDFRSYIAAYLTKKYGWELSAKNIAVANGGQSAFFALYNMFAGPTEDGTHRTIHLPLAPEYIGYRDLGMADDIFSATRPVIDKIGDTRFKYRVDFNHLKAVENVAALAVSRPTNPTGNVLTNEEVAKISGMALERDVPLILDGAYGLPFPNIIFSEAEAFWNDNTILVLSLSKLGLPGVRTGIIVGSEQLVEAYANFNTIASLACGGTGPAMTKDWFRTGEIDTLTSRHVAPFYRERSLTVQALIKEELKGLPFRMHLSEGAIFLWMWFEDMPISAQQLYERLKKRSVLVVPGQNFFVGLEDDWHHQHECIRLSYAQDQKTIRQGIKILAEEVSVVYSEC